MLNDMQKELMNVYMACNKIAFISGVLALNEQEHLVYRIHKSDNLLAHSFQYNYL